MSVSVKLLVTVLLFFIAILFAYIPFFFKLKSKKSNIFLSYNNCFAGGVILGAFLMHLMPEMVSNATGHHHSHHESDGTHSHHSDEGSFLVGPFSAGCSFLFLLALDRLFLTHSHCEILEDPSQKPVKHHSNDEELAHTIEDSEDDHGSCHSDDMVAGCHVEGLNARISKTQTFIFVLALSTHSYFEGFGMATKNTTSDLYSYLISLFGHKWLEAFALGVSIMRASYSSIHSFLLIMLYSSLTPIGILTGLFLEQHFKSGIGEIVVKVLNGFAVGSFLFVSCIEVIPPEFHKKTKHSPYKFLVLLIGFLCMSSLSLFHIH